MVVVGNKSREEAEILTQQVDAPPNSNPYAEGVQNHRDDHCDVFQDHISALCAETCRKSTQCYLIH
jgi:hypothetical protein